MHYTERMTPMRIEQLQYLVKIAECGSITKAAKQLYLSQPSLTKAIQQLEAEYKIQLFTRSATGIELTSSGKNFLHRAKDVLASAEALHDLYNGYNPYQSLLSLAAVQWDALYEMVHQVYDHYSDRTIHLNIMETDRGEVAQAVLSGDVDLGIAVGTNGDSSIFGQRIKSKDLDVYTIAQSPPMICVGPKSPLYHRDSVNYHEAESFGNVVLDMEKEARRDRNLNATNRFNMNRVTFVNTISACEHFLMHTDAVQYVTPWVCGCFRDPAIRMIPITPTENEPAFTNELLLLKRKGNTLTEPENYFAKLLFRHYDLPFPQSLTGDETL